jgi:glycosyltransferase involved in cell wall biosynthesis
MKSIVWLDPLNRDAHFLKLVSQIAYKYNNNFELITTQRSGLEINSHIPLHPFLSELDLIDTGVISWKNKLNILSNYYTAFDKVSARLNSNNLLLYSSGMSLPELEYLGIQKVKRNVAKLIFLIHNLEDTQSNLSRLSAWRNNKLIKTFDGWIFLSHYMRQKTVARLKLPIEKTYVLPHPHFHPILENIELDRQTFSEIQDFAQKRPIMAYISTLDNAHGIDIFYQVLSELQRQGVDLCGVVLGRLAAANWNSQQNLLAINRYGLTEKQLYLKIGTYTYPELLAVLSMTDFVLAPYRNISQSGAIALALGEGVPVIASNTGGNMEMVKDNINGLLFELNNLEKLIKEIIFIYNSGQNMRQKMPVLHSFNDHLDPYIAVENMLEWINSLLPS